MCDSEMIQSRILKGEFVKRKTIEQLAQAIAEYVTKHEDTVFPYVGNGYVLDQDGLLKVLTEALIEHL
jgi:hypothetical protein